MTPTTETQKSSSSWRQWLVFGLCLLPAVGLAILLRQNTVNVPYWDEWDDDLASIFLKWHNGTLSFGDYWAQHNESRLVLPRAIFLLLGIFSHWNLGWEVATTFLLAAFAAGGVFWLGHKTLAARPLVAGVAAFIASLLIFAPAQYQAWLWGMELILYLPLVCILASLCFLQTNFSKRTKIFFGGVMAVASTYSFSNGMLAWLALFPVLFLADGLAGLKKLRRAALLWLLAFVANVALYFQDYQFPTSPGLWSVLCNHPWQVVAYLFAFLGGPLVDQNSDYAVTAGVIIGGFQFTLFLALGVVIFRRRKNSEWMRRVWPWLTLGGYGVLSALLATSGRAAFGAAQALSPRYGIFGVCLTVALVYLVPLVAFYSAPSVSGKMRMMVAALAVAVIGLHALALPAALVNMEVFSLNLRHAKACLKFLDVLPPQPATRAYLCPSFAKVKTMADALDRAHVWNYSLLPTRRLADLKTAPQPVVPLGDIENCRVLGTNFFLSGWALASARRAPADCVVFTCEGAGNEPQIFALMDERLVRTDLVEKFHDKKYFLAGWQKICPFADLPKGALTVRAWSYDAATDRLTPLANVVKLANP